MSEQPKQEQEQKQEQPSKPVSALRTPSLGERISLLWYSKRAWLVLGVLVFVLGLGILAPVGKIPLLRRLAYAMGYSQDEASHLSLLRALFTWNDHAKMVRGERPAHDEMSVFGGKDDSSRAQNKLFNLRAVNAALAKQGLRGETIANSSNRPESENPRVSDIRVRNTEASANTQANKAQNGAVFFGAETDQIQRNKNDGFDSVNSLKKIKNPNIAGASPSGSWMDRLVDKAVRTDAQLENIAQGVDRSGSTLANLGNIQAMGDSRAKRDMYYAWLTGRAARRTPQVVLKKTLAEAGFNGAEIPRTVFTATGFSGVGIKPDDVIADVDTVQKYLKLDKECQEALAHVSLPPLDDLRSIPGSLYNAFPNNCDEINFNAYDGLLYTVNTKCQQMGQAYDNIPSSCSTLMFDLQDKCNSEKLTTYKQEFIAYCQSKEQTCHNQANQHPDDPDAYANCMRGFTSQEFTVDGIVWRKGDLPDDAQDTFFDGDLLNSDYFPGINWAHSLWLDENAGD